MKKVLLLVMVLSIGVGIGYLAAPQITQAGWIPELWTDEIQAIGSVRRISFHICHCDSVDGETQCEWHYFGTDPTEKPPSGVHAHWPIVQHAYVQLPNDIDYLGAAGSDLLYDMGVTIGLVREGLREP